MTENPARSKKHWAVLAGACGMAGASIGISINVIGVFFTPVSQDLGIYRGSFAFHATLASIALAFTSLFIPKLIEKIGWKPALAIGILLGGLVGTSGMALTTNVIVFNLLGAIRGVGVALFAMVPLTMIVNGWFEEKHGLAMSVGFGFSGIAGAIFSPIMTSLIGNYGWETAIVIKGIIMTVLCLPALLVPYSLDPREDGYLPYGHDPDIEKERTVIKREEWDAFSYKNIVFIALFSFSFIHTMIIGLSQHLPGFAESLNLSSQTGGWMMSAVMIGNITFKLVIGTLSDVMGIVKSTVLMIGLNMLAIVLLLSWQRPIPLIVNSWLFGTVFCVPAVAFPLLATQFFGKVQASKVYPILTFAMGIGGAISVTIIGYIYDFTDSYSIAYMIGFGLHVLNLGLLFLCTKKSREQKEASLA